MIFLRLEFMEIFFELRSIFIATLSINLSHFQVFSRAIRQRLVDLLAVLSGLSFLQLGKSFFARSIWEMFPCFPRILQRRIILGKLNTLAYDASYCW